MTVSLAALEQVTLLVIPRETPKRFICETCGAQWTNEHWPEEAHETGMSKRYVRSWKLGYAMAGAAFCSRKCRQAEGR